MTSNEKAVAAIFSRNLISKHMKFLNGSLREIERKCQDDFGNMTNQNDNSIMFRDDSFNWISESLWHPMKNGTLENRRYTEFKTILRFYII